LLRYERGTLVEHFVRLQQRDYALRNRSQSERSVQLALDVVNNAKIEHADAVVVLDGGAVSAQFRVAGESVRRVRLLVSEGLERRLELHELGAARLRAIAADRNLAPPARAILDSLARQKRLLAEIALLQPKAERARNSLPAVAKADPERGRALAAELVRTEARIAECERARAELDPERWLAAAKLALAQLNAGARAGS
jgi:hypothetical protein